MDGKVTLAHCSGHSPLCKGRHGSKAGGSWSRYDHSQEAEKD